MRPYAPLIASGVVLGLAQGLGQIVKACSLTCNVGYRALPFAFLAISLSSLLIVPVKLRLEKRWGRRGWQINATLLAAASLLVFRLGAFLAIQGHSVFAVRTVYLAFYVWLAIIFSILVSNLLGRAGESSEGRQAGKAVIYVSAAILLGGLLGGWSAGVINSHLQSWLGGRFEIVRDHMMIAMALILLVDIGLIGASPAASGSQLQSNPNPWPEWDWMRSHPMLAALAFLCFTGGCAAIVSDYLFYWLITEQVRSSGGFVAYFSAFYIWLNGFSLLVATCGVEPMVKRAGLAVALALLPLSLFFGAAYLLFHITVLAMYWFRIVEEGLWDPFYEPVKENLYLRVDPARYDALRSVLDGLVYRTGQAAASVLVLILASAFHASMRSMIGILILIYFLWFAAVINVRARGLSRGEEQ